MGAAINTSWRLNFIDKISGPLKRVQGAASKIHSRLGKVQNSLNKISAIDLQALDYSTQRVKEGFQQFNDVAIKHESALAEVKSITGLVGEKLDAIDDSAKNLSKTFGGSVSDNLGSFKVLLSKLGPDIGNNAEALEGLGEVVQVMSKTMEGDVEGATDSITNSMLQFRVSLEDPLKAAEEAKRMMNIMASGAQEGSAEIIEVSAALKQAGGVARLANVSFAETNSAIQFLDKAGKKGAEGGVALRNVLLKMNAPGKVTARAAAELSRYGVNMDVVSNKALPLAQRLKELQKIGNNTNALTLMFGNENIQGAEALINQAEGIGKLAKEITGTNVAYEQAGMIMDTSAERSKRWQARLDILKISVGNYTKHLQPFVNVGADGISMLANMGNAMRGVKMITDATRIAFGFKKAAQVSAIVTTSATTVATTGLAGAQARTTVATRGLKGGLRGLSATLSKVILRIRAMSLAFLSSPIGLIVAGLAAVASVSYGVYKVIEKQRDAVNRLNPVWRRNQAILRVNKELQERVNKATSAQTTNLKLLTSIAANEKNTLESRKKALKELIEIDPRYQEALRGDIILTEKLKKTTKELTAEIIRNAETAGRRKMLEEKAEEATRLEMEVEKMDKKFEDYTALNAVGSTFANLVGAGDFAKSDKLKKQLSEAREDRDAIAGKIAKVDYNTTKSQPTGTTSKQALQTPFSTGANTNKLLIGNTSSEQLNQKPSISNISTGAVGGGKSINMTLNIKNTFKVVGDKLSNNIEELADKFAGELNDRLRDGLIALEG